MLCFSPNAPCLYTAFPLFQKPFGSHYLFLRLVKRTIPFQTVLNYVALPFSLSHVRHLHLVCSFANAVCLFAKNLTSELHSVRGLHCIVIGQDWALGDGTPCVCRSLTLAQLEMCLLRTYLQRGCQTIAVPCERRRRLLLLHPRVAQAVTQLYQHSRNGRFEWAVLTVLLAWEFSQLISLNCFCE
jgi:hypothetical protein